MEQVNYLPNSLIFSGYWLSKCNLNRSPDDEIIKINVSILNLSLNSAGNQFTITYNFQLISQSGNESTIQYISLFTINNQSFSDNFCQKIENGDVKLSDDSNTFILLMLQMSYPYIRQAISSLTNDACSVINLPIADVKTLLNNGLQLQRVVVSEEKKSQEN